MSRLFDAVLDFFFPNRCPCCGSFIGWNSLICEKCEGSFETADFCRKCGRKPCICEEGDFDCDGCAVAAVYSGSVRDGVLEFKYRCGFNIAKYFAQPLCDILDSYGFTKNADLITAVPMSKKRRSLTGYNQAEYIAKLISKKTGLPKDFGLLKKAGSDIFQHDLSAEERRNAVVGKYSPKRGHADIAGKTVILCDDIITTGSTLSECSRVLKEMGAEKVYAAVLSGTPFENRSGDIPAKE